MKGVLERNKDVIWRRIEDNIVLIGKEGMEIHTLNKTAAKIWELCDGTNGIDQITANICDSYDVTPEEADISVREVIDKMEKMGLIEKKGEEE
jgi:hypothetical protein